MAGVQGVYTLTTTGPGAWIPINLNAFNQGVGILVTLQGTNPTCTYNVEVTGDRVTGPITHVNLHDTMNNLTTSKNGSLAYPCAAIRLNPSALGGTNPSLTIAIVQAVD